MDSFQIIVLSIFVILAILLLTAFAIMIRSKKDDKSEYPATYSQCPDYWVAQGNFCLSDSKNNGNNNWKNNFDGKTGNTAGYSVNINNSGKDGVNFNHSDWDNTIYDGVSKRCALKRWANTYEIVWDGINNYTSSSC